MEKYSKAVSEMYSQSKKKEAHPMEKYTVRLANCRGKQVEAVGHSHTDSADEPLLITDASQTVGWDLLESFDAVFKNCEKYYYVYTDNLIG